MLFTLMRPDPHTSRLSHTAEKTCARNFDNTSLTEAFTFILALFTDGKPQDYIQKGTQRLDSGSNVQLTLLPSPFLVVTEKA
jgi:hypothetical protein